MDGHWAVRLEGAVAPVLHLAEIDQHDLSVVLAGHLADQAGEEQTVVGQGGLQQEKAVVVDEIQTGLEQPGLSVEQLVEGYRAVVQEGADVQVQHGLAVLSAGLKRQESHHEHPVVGQGVVEQEEGGQLDLTVVPAVTQSLGFAV